MKITIYAIVEIPSVHKIMDSIDLSDGGKKIYSEVINMTYNQDKIDKKSFENTISDMFFKSPRKSNISKDLGKPVFILAYSDLNHYLVHFRKNVNQISDGKKIFRLIDIINNFGLSCTTNKRMEITSIGIKDDDDNYIKLQNFKQMKK